MGTIRSDGVETETFSHELLVIDDSQLIHKLLKHNLKVENVHILSAKNGEEGLRMARDIQPTLILLDLNMPGMDGFEVLRALKDDPATLPISVIVISGSDETEDKVTGLDLGAVDYVCKPVEAAELRARVRSALRIAELMAMLEQRAQIDGLTGLWNRKYFDDRLADELSAKQRAGRDLSLALCDLDNFKSLNDTYGHAAGDAVLQSFAKILGKSLRRSDIACRYGGEEFGLILPDTKASAASIVLERVRVDLEETAWPRHPERNVTASFGVCDMVAGGSLEPLAWIETADKALYVAKSGGRNRVHVVDAKAMSEEALRAAG